MAMCRNGKQVSEGWRKESGELLLREKFWKL